MEDSTGAGPGRQYSCGALGSPEKLAAGLVASAGASAGGIPRPTTLGGPPAQSPQNGYANKQRCARQSSLRSALVRDGNYSRHTASRVVRFAEPLVESYFHVPCQDQTPCLVSIVPGEGCDDKGSLLFGDILLEDLEGGAMLGSSIGGAFTNPVFGGRRSTLLGEAEDECMKQDFFCEHTRCHWGLADSGRCKEQQAKVLCGIGLAWILFTLGWFFFPVWYLGVFSVCMSRDKRDAFGALACGIGALVATLVFILVIADSAEPVQPFLDSNFRLY